MSSLFGTQQQLTHPPVKSSTLPLRKMPIFQGVAPWHTIFTSSCVIPLWDSATAHSPSGKELILSSLEESCFSGLIVLLMFSHYPAWAFFGLVLTHITHYLWSISIAKDHRFAEACSSRLWWMSFCTKVACHFFFLDKTLESNIMVVTTRKSLNTRVLLE